jgi:hypothetical protein
MSVDISRWGILRIAKANCSNISHTTGSRSVRRECGRALRESDQMPLRVPPSPKVDCALIFDSSKHRRRLGTTLRSHSTRIGTLFMTSGIACDDRMTLKAFWYPTRYTIAEIVEFARISIFPRGCFLIGKVHNKGRYRQPRAIAISKPQPRLQNACVRASPARMDRLGTEFYRP